MPPVELTEEEKTKFEALLKEKGYDEHAKDVIARTNAEAKASREAKEKADADKKALEDENKKLKDADEKRKTEEDRVKKEQEDKQKKLDDEKKTLDERLEGLRTEIAGQFADTTKAQKAEVKALVEQIKERDDKIQKRDERILRDAVRATAKERGIIDVDIADHLDMKDVKGEDGLPDQEAIDKLIDDHAKAKPHLYKEGEERERDSRGQFVRASAAAKDKSGKAVDWSKLTDKEFAEREAELRARR